MNKENSNDQNSFRKYVLQKIFLTISIFLIVIVINIIINKYLGEYFNIFAQSISDNYILTGLSFFLSELFIGIFPAELFMIIYQSKGWGEFSLIVLSLGLISSLCATLAFIAGKYFNDKKFMSWILVHKKALKLIKFFTQLSRSPKPRRYLIINLVNRCFYTLYLSINCI